MMDERQSLDSLLPIVYQELRRLAASYLRRERPGPRAVCGAVSPRGVDGCAGADSGVVAEERRGPCADARADGVEEARGGRTSHHKMLW